MSQFNPDLEEGIKSESDAEVTEPPMYKVLLLNDDYTTMEFVVEVLRYVFHRTIEEATRIMLNIHNQGIGIAGVYTREIGETKISVVHDIAKKNQYPLKCSLEKVST